MLSRAEHVGCLLSFGNVRVSPGGRAVVEGWLCQPAAHTPSVAIKTSYGFRATKIWGKWGSWSQFASSERQGNPASVGNKFVNAPYILN